MNRGLLLVLLGWPALAAAWEEEPALAFILAYHPVVAAQRQATASYQPPGTLRAGCWNTPRSTSARRPARPAPSRRAATPPPATP